MHRVLVLLLLAGCPAVSPSSGTQAASESAVQSVDVAQLKSDLANGKVAVLVDVRTDREWKGGHVPGALHIPLDQLDRRTDELQRFKSKEIYFVCHSGGRSGKAATALAKKGFKTINVDGGTAAWRAAGNPIKVP